MVLPTRLRSKVLTELSALDLRSALSELKSYREPPRPSGWFWWGCCAPSAGGGPTSLTGGAACSRT